MQLTTLDRATIEARARSQFRLAGAAVRAEFAHDEGTFVAWSLAYAEGRTGRHGGLTSAELIAERVVARERGPLSVSETERLATDEWQSSPAVRTEFRDNKAAFLAYRRAEAAGLVRMTG